MRLMTLISERAPHSIYIIQAENNKDALERFERGEGTLVAEDVAAEDVVEVADRKLHEFS